METGENVLIGAIIVGGSDAQIIVRAIGPSWEKHNVSDALMDPTLEIHGQDGSLLFSNDDWKDAQQAEIEASGIAPTDDRESALIATLSTGNYTAIVSGKGDRTGVGLVEVYNLD